MSASLSPRRPPAQLKSKSQAKAEKDIHAKLVAVHYSYSSLDVSWSPFKRPSAASSEHVDLSPGAGLTVGLD